MISMPQIQSIRSRRRNGESIASIARSERVSEPTVRKYLRVDDLSARPPVRRRRGSVIDEWLPVIEGMLAEDRETCASSGIPRPASMSGCATSTGPGCRCRR